MIAARVGGFGFANHFVSTLPAFPSNMIVAHNVAGLSNLRGAAVAFIGRIRKKDRV
jgi:hypothetical protein